MPEITDLDETAARLEGLLERATKGPWELDTLKNEGYYGSGPDCSEGFESYKIVAASGNSLLDSLNSEAAVVYEDGPDEFGAYHAWDDVALRNFELIVAMKNALPALLSERRALRAECERLRQALRTCAGQFRFYEQQHLSKGTADGNDKAKTNADFALMAETLLAPNGGEHD